MSEEKYIVKTGSGSMYPVKVDKRIFGKTEVKIIYEGSEETVLGIVADRAEIGKGDVANSVSEKNLVPGKLIIFQQKGRMGNTSRISEVYRKVA